MNQNRIQINGEWYVKETSIEKDVLIGEDELIFEKKCTYENVYWLFEAYFMETQISESQDKCYIDVVDKRNEDNIKHSIDENMWILSVLRDAPYAIVEAREMLDEEGLNYFKAFAQILVDKGWIIKK